MIPSAKILEIFESIQGEGKYAGASQVFVRFFECNMHCVWCDTPHSIGDTTRHYKEFSVVDIARQIKAFGKVHSVSLTGGEPLLQADFIKVLIPSLKKQKIYLDTNGTLPAELKKVIGGIDIIAMDLKLPSSTKQRAFWKEHEDFLKIAKKKDVFVKVVISKDTDVKEVEQAARLVAKIDKNILFILQPNFFEMKEGSVKRALELYPLCSKMLADVRVLPQMHKFLKVR